MPPNAHFWQVGLLDIVLSEYPDKSHNFRNFIFMTSHFSTLSLIIFNLIELRFLSCTVPPSFNGFSPDRVVVENDPVTITLSCSADGNPTPTVNWTRVFDGSDSDVLFTGNSYVINNNKNNAGTYRCKADNGIGSAINQTIRVTVNCKYSAFPIISG